MSKGQGNRNLGHNLAQKPIALMGEQIVGCESGTETCVRHGGREAKPPLRHQKKVKKLFKKVLTNTTKYAIIIIIQKGQTKKSKSPQ